MSLSNSLMYEGRLECGSERTATSLINLPHLPSVLFELSSGSAAEPQQDLAWIQATLLPSNPVCFLDCSVVRIMDAEKILKPVHHGGWNGPTTKISCVFKVPALETVEPGGISNHTEAVLIRKLLLLLIKVEIEFSIPCALLVRLLAPCYGSPSVDFHFQAGCKPNDVGVIAPYRQQLKTISGLLQASAFTGVEVNTVDRYQGRDKSLIILSFVRSTAEEGAVSVSLIDSAGKRVGWLMCVFA